MMILMVLIVFILALDKNALTLVLHRPLVACTLMGLALNQVQTGAALGAAMELIVLGAENRNSNTVLYSAAAVIFAVRSGMDTNTAIASALIFAWFGVYLDGAFEALTALFLPMARKAAEKRDEKQLFLANILPGLIKALLFAICAGLLYNGAEHFSTVISGLEENAGWVLAGLSVSGSLMKCAGFAILLRNIQAQEVPGALLAGISTAALFAVSSQKGSGLLICALAAFAIAAYVLKTHAEGEKSESVKAGGAKWW